MQFDPIEVAMTTAYAAVTVPATIDGCRYYSARTAAEGDFDVKKTSAGATSYPIFGSEEFQDNTGGTFYKTGAVLFYAKMSTASDTDTLHVIVSE